jgi:hypothetical protein
MSKPFRDMSDSERIAARIGIKAGVARAAALSPRRRQEIAKRAAAARWAKRG